MKAFCCFSLIIALLIPRVVSAGEKGKLVSLLADYADLKQRVQAIQSARQNGYSSDSKEMIDLWKQIQAAKNELDTYHSELKAGSDDRSHTVPLALGYAYTAMSQLLKTELDRNLYKSDLAAKLSHKYADIWQTVDPLIPLASAPTAGESEAPEVPSSAASSPPLAKPISAGQLKLSNVVTSVSRYGVLFANFTVQNISDQNMKDFTVDCLSYAPSGTVLSHPSKTLYEIIRAKSAQEYEGVEIGPVHNQSSKILCQIVNAVPIR